MTIPTVPEGFGVPLVDLATGLLPAQTMNALDARYEGGGGTSDVTVSQDEITPGVLVLTDGAATFRSPSIGDDGKVDASVLPNVPAAGNASVVPDPGTNSRITIEDDAGGGWWVPVLDYTGKLDPSALPASESTGTPTDWSWHFPGELLVRTGLAMLKVPGSGIAPAGKTFLGIALVATLGTRPTASPGNDVRIRVAANGSTLKELVIPSGSYSEQVLIGQTIPSLDMLSVDILQVPSSAAIKAADLTVQLWWRWA